MSKFIVFALVLAAACLILASAAPAPDSQILDAQTAINKIIGELPQLFPQAIKLCSNNRLRLLLFLHPLAAYNRIPGRSIVHPWEVATLIDPNTFVVHY